MAEGGQSGSEIPEIKSIALCLSGGGLRATFYHFGTVKALAKANLLEKVTHVFSVSGGSILAAHMVSNWNKYCGDEQSLHDMENELHRLGKRDIRGRVIRRWFLTAISLLLPEGARLRRGPTQHLISEYQNFLKEKTFADLKNIQPKPPILHLLTTNLSSGELCSFSSKGYHVGLSGTVFGHASIPLAFAVAASSAYPPLFPPVRIRHRDKLLSFPVSEFLIPMHRLTDGGVYDNLGFEKALALEADGQMDVDLIIISNASAEFDWEIDKTYLWPISRMVRSVDILMNRVSGATLSRAKSDKKTHHILHCPITDDPQSDTPEEIRSRLKFIRTDLDKFNEVEVTYLINQGFEVTSEKLNTLSLSKNSPTPYAAGDTGRITAVLDRGAERQWRFFAWDDWATYALAFLMGIVPAAAIFYLVVLPRYELANQSASLENASQSKTALINDLQKLEEQKRDLLKKVTELEAIVPTPSKKCRIPSNGVESWKQSQVLTQASGWRGGGFDQVQWCNQLIQMTRGNFPNPNLIEVTGSREEQKSTCLPFNCPQYNYYCTIKIQWDPVYYEKESPLCP